MRRYMYASLSIIVNIALLSCAGQNTINKVDIGKFYDCSLFLRNCNVTSHTENQDNILKWEWSDVDPLQLFSEEENRFHRREMYIDEISCNAPLSQTIPPTNKQLDWGHQTSKDFNASVIMNSSTVKIVLPYSIKLDEMTYKSDADIQEVRFKSLELASSLGVTWAILEGSYLYLYNGCILIAKFDRGRVLYCDPYLDSLDYFYHQND